LVYEPAVFGAATVRFRDTAKGIDEDRDYNLLVPIAGKAELLSWKTAEFVDVNPDRLPDEGEPGALYYVRPGSAADPKKAIVTLRQDLDDICMARRPTRWRIIRTEMYAETGESASEFAGRVMQAAKEARDAELDAVHARFQKKMDDLSKRLEKEQQEMEADRADYSSRVAEEALTGASTVASFFGFGRRRTLSSMATKRRMTVTAPADIAETEQALARLQAEMTGWKRHTVKRQMRSSPAGKRRQATWIS
jgi:hypothetical protein